MHDPALAAHELVEGWLARMLRVRLAAPLSCALLLAACGNNSDVGVPADRVGVGAICTSTDDCPRVVTPEDEAVQLECLTEFRGGYCGIPDCATNEDCPRGSSCVRHDDGQTYCFRDCSTKSECNRHRPEDSAANCSANFEFNDPADDAGQKACVPPSSGD